MFCFFSDVLIFVVTVDLAIAGIQIRPRDLVRLGLKTNQLKGLSLFVVKSKNMLSLELKSNETASFDFQFLMQIKVIS